MSDDLMERAADAYDRVYVIMDQDEVDDYAVKSLVKIGNVMRELIDRVKALESTGTRP